MPKRRLQLVANEPSEQEIEYRTEHMYTAHIRQFAAELDIARSMWQQHPNLVEAPGFPEYLLESLRTEGDAEPGDCGVHDEFMAPDLRDIIRDEVIEHLRSETRSAA